MTVHLCIPNPPVPLPNGRTTDRGIVIRTKLRWTNHHPCSHYGLGVLLDGKGQMFDGQMFRHLRERVDAWMESEDDVRVRGALGLPPDEPVGPPTTSPSDQPEMLVAEDVALAWGLTTGRVRQLCRAGEVPSARKVGRDWAVPRADVAKGRWVEPGPPTGALK